MSVCGSIQACQHGWVSYILSIIVVHILPRLAISRRIGRQSSSIVRWSYSTHGPVSTACHHVRSNFTRVGRVYCSISSMMCFLAPPFERFTKTLSVSMLRYVLLGTRFATRHLL